jgi:flagellar hook-associated protein 1 FlgK
MSSSLIGIATSGLNAASMGLATTSHNIANVNTPGYSRQQLVQRAALADFSGAGSVGKGVAVSTVQRIVSDFATQQGNLATSEAAKSNTQLDYVTRFADLLTNSDTALSTTMNSLFSSVQDLAAHPAGVTERQSMLAKGQALADSINGLDGQLTTASGEIGARLQTNVAQLNSLSTQVATLNDQIAQIVGSGQQPNDLQDQRDSLIRKMSALVHVNVLNQPDGRVNVFLSSGDSLVLRGDTTQLTVQADPNDPAKFVLSSTGAATGGKVRAFQSSVDLGGEVGGLLLTQTDISNARNSLGRIAITLGDAMNQQQALGQDLNGNPGVSMFQIGSPRAYAIGGSAGALNIAIADSTQLKASDYTLAFDGTNYQLSRASDGTQQTFSSMPQTVDGMSIAVTTPMVAGSSFAIQPVREGAAQLKMLLTDASKIAAASPVLAQSGTTNLGSGRIASLDVNGPTRDPNLTAGVQITFTGASSYNYTRTAPSPTSGSGTIGSNGQIVLNGWTMKVDGTPKNGDTFSVGANTTGMGDSRNLLAMSALSSKKLVDGSSVVDANSALIGTLGNRAESLKISAAANDALLQQATQQEQGVSGVNLDEEAANMMRYQQAYQASAKMISALNTMFDTIMKIAG